MMNMGVIFFALIILTLNVWTTAHAGAYAWGVAGAEVANRSNKTPFLFGGLVIATLLACTGIYAKLISFLVFLGVFIPPLGGVLLGDYVFTYKRHIPALQSVRFKAFRIAPVLAYVVGTVVAYATDRQGIGIPPLFGIIVAALCVPLFNSLMRALKIDDMHVSVNNPRGVWVSGR